MFIKFTRFVLHLRGWFEKSVQSRRDGTTGVYRGYFQLVTSLERTHNKFQPDRSISLCLDQGSRVISKKWMKEDFLC